MNTGDELLSHEIGHALSLLHVNGQPTFNQTNVMHNASNTRQFLTEGQFSGAYQFDVLVIDSVSGHWAVPARARLRAR